MNLCEYNCSIETAPTVNIGQGLLAYYSFDNHNFQDESGNKKDAVLEEGTLEFTTGVKGEAIVIDTSDTVKLPVDLINGTTNFTINVWVKEPENGDNFDLLYGMSNNSGGEFEIYLYQNSSDNKTNVRIYYHGEYDQAIPIPNLSSGFHMLTFVRNVNEKVLKLYVDGKFYDSFVDKDSLNLSELWFGYSASNDVFDELAFWDRPLSEEEIETLYEECTSGK